MNLNELLQRYVESNQVRQLKELLTGGDDFGEVHLKGMIGSQDAFVAAATFKSTDYNHFFILGDKEESAYFQNNLKNILENKDIFFFPDSFKRPQDFSELNNNNVLLRTETVNRLSNSTSRGEIAVSYPEAMLEKVVRAAELQEQTLRMKVNEKLDIDFMIDLLVGFEFERVDFVYEPGQFSIRGDIIDIFSYGNEYPYRVELFGEEIESIRTFDPLTQLSVKKIASVTIVPNIQTHFGNDMKASVLEVFPPNTIIWIKDAATLMDVLNMAMEKAAKIQPDIKKNRVEHPNHPLLEGAPEEVFLSSADFIRGIGKFTVIEFGKQSFFKTESRQTFFPDILLYKLFVRRD